MNKKKVLIFSLLLCLFLVANSSYSQTDDKKFPRTPEDIATKKSERMRQELSLSDEQYRTIYDLFLQNIKERQANRDKNKETDKQSMKVTRKQNKKEFRKQLESILTSEQLSKFKSMKGNKHGKAKREKKNKNKAD